MPMRSGCGLHEVVPQARRSIAGRMLDQKTVASGNELYRSTKLKSIFQAGLVTHNERLASYFDFWVTDCIRCNQVFHLIILIK